MKTEYQKDCAPSLGNRPPLLLVAEFGTRSYKVDNLARTDQREVAGVPALAPSSGWRSLSGACG